MSVSQIESNSLKRIVFMQESLKISQNKQKKRVKLNAELENLICSPDKQSVLCWVMWLSELESREHHRWWWFTFLALLFLIPTSRVEKMKTMFHISGTLPHFLEGSLLCSHTACAFVLVSFAQSLSLLGRHFSGEPFLWIPLVEQCPFVCHWLSTYSKPCFFKALNISWNECSMQARFLLLFLILIILCVWIFCVNVCTSHTCVQYQGRPGEGVRCTGTGFTEAF